jgi:hypothetical protein
VHNELFSKYCYRTASLQTTMSQPYFNFVRFVVTRTETARVAAVGPAKTLLGWG